MAEIKYFSSDNNGSFVRPLSYGFPAGLNALPLTVDYLVVAGGGGGTTDNAGGGGAGGFRTSSGYDLTASTSYTVTEIGRAHV